MLAPGERNIISALELLSFLPPRVQLQANHAVDHSVRCFVVGLESQEAGLPNALVSPVSSECHAAMRTALFEPNRKH